MNEFENVSYGDGQTNFFGAQTSAELREKLNNYGKFELRGLAAKIGINPNYSNSTLKNLILQEFRIYKAKNSPIPAPETMFANASEDIIKMMKSVGTINQEEREKRKYNIEE